MPGATRRRSRRRLRGNRRAALTLGLLPALALLALPGQVAFARPAPAGANAGLLARALPSPCLLGAVLCGQEVLKNPGAPLPTPCLDQLTGLQVLCGSTIVRVGPPPPPVVSPNPTPTGGSGRGAGGGNGGGTTVGVTAAGPAAGAPLPVPLGVGIIAPAQAATTSGPNPDPLAVLLSLSIRDGLSTGRFSVWPWLAGIQVLLLLGLLGVACSRQLTAASAPPKD
jgi:hypothetical protein